MAANVLNSSQAIQMSVFVIRAFVKMRTALGNARELSKRLAALEKELKLRLDIHDLAIFEILQRITTMLDPPAPPPEPPRPQIGFKEDPIPSRA